jgi:hypothetical protein
VREFLSESGVAFDDVDIAAAPEAMEDLRRLGAVLPPVVAVGERWVHGWNPRGIAALLDVRFEASAHLSTVQLIERLDRMMAAAIRAARQVPDNKLQTKSPQRDRTLLDTVAHVFHIGEIYPRALTERRCPVDWFLEETPATVRNSTALVEYGEGVRRMLAAFFAPRADAIAADTGVVESHEGPQTPTVLLERTVWHAAQHIRQVYEILAVVGIVPDRPLTASDYEGLPLPENIW